MMLKNFGGLGPGGFVVRGHGENFLDPQIHPPLAGADVADALQHLVEIVGDAGTGNGRVFQPLVVHGETLDDVLLQPLGGPDAEAGGNVAFDPVADRDDHVQIVIIELALALAAPFQSN